MPVYTKSTSEEIIMLIKQQLETHPVKSLPWISWSK